jgi:hypothetical protein
VERDPTSYTLYGSNSAIGGGTAVSSLTLISSGSFTLPANRNLIAGDAFSSTVTFTNTTAYSNYLIIFPTIKNAPGTANSMQIGEVVFTGTAVPEVSGSLLLVAGVLPMLRRRRR